ncbi:MAG: hypothetical protein WAW37_18030 [Syntrophobacteraceae bacterium]
MLMHRDLENKNLRIITFLLALLAFIPRLATAQDTEAQDRIKLQNNAMIIWGYVYPPNGNFILIRKATNTCAVRFTESHRGGDQKPGTVFISGDESLYAEYDWFCQSDGSGDFTKSNVQSGHKQLTRKPLVGIGRFAFQTGNIKVQCGPFNLSWIYPSGIGFFGSQTPQDYGIELSPNKWKKIEEIDIHSPIKWYRYDEHRKKIYIPETEL